MKPQYSIVEQHPARDSHDGIRGWEGVRQPYVCHTEAYARKRAASLFGGYEGWAQVWVDGRPLQIAPSNLPQYDIDDEIPW